MKKGIIIVASCLLVLFALSLIPAWSPAQPAAEQKDWPKAIAISAGPAGTGVFSVALGLASMIKTKLGIAATNLPVGGGVQESLARVKRGEAHMFGQNVPDTYFLFRGEKTWEKTGRAPVRMWAMGGAQGTHIAARNASGIATLADLKGKRVMVNTPSFSQMDAFLITLEAAGLRQEDVRLVTWKSLAGDAMPSLETGAVDAVFNIITMPATRFQQTIHDRPVHLVPFTEGQIEYIIKKYPYYNATVFPAGYTKGQDKDIPTFGAFYGLVLYDEQLSESLVYALTKLVWDNLDDFHQVHPTAVHYTIKNTLGSHQAAPFHAGTIKYFKEIKAWTAEHEKIQNELLELEKKLGKGQK